MCLRRNFIVTLVTACSGVALADSGARLEADADPAAVAIPPVTDGRKLVRLPALEFQISVRGSCADEQRAESISVSIADTRKTVTAEELPNPPELVIDLAIPASQVAPLPMDGFCAGAEATENERLIADVMTAHLSLRCAGADGDSITYAARPLSIALTCAEQDQGDSEPSILR